MKKNVLLAGIIAIATLSLNSFISCSSEAAYDKDSYNENDTLVIYTVTYSDGINEEEIEVPVDNKHYNTGDVVNVKFDGIGNRTNYEFIGWSDGENIYTNTLTKTFVMGSKNVLLTALWALVNTEYQFHEKIEYLPQGTDGSAGKNAIYCYFGDFPQSVKSNSVIINEDETVKKGGFTYFKGNDGNWYAKCIENRYKANTSTNIYSDGTVIGTEEKYFKVEPIKWRILNPNKSENKLLLAESILMSGISFYAESSIIRNLGYSSIYSNNYKYSNIRAYLNGTKNQFVLDGGKNDSSTTDWTNKGFLQTAFTAKAQKIIAVTTVDNSEESATVEGREIQQNSYVCTTTNDKIFLLSQKEATSKQYDLYKFVNGHPFENRIRSTTDWARANYAFQSIEEKQGGSWYLRSPSDDDCSIVHTDGATTYIVASSSTSTGIVPALTVCE